MARAANERAACGRLGRKPTNHHSNPSEGHVLYAFSGEKLVPALPWSFPVIVQCCETEKAMCVDAKVNLGPRNRYCESRGDGWDGYFQVFLVKNRRGPSETILRPKPSA